MRVDIQFWSWETQNWPLNTNSEKYVNIKIGQLIVINYDQALNKWHLFQKIKHFFPKHKVCCWPKEYKKWINILKQIKITPHIESQNIHIYIFLQTKSNSTLLITHYANVQLAMCVQNKIYNLHPFKHWQLHIIDFRHLVELSLSQVH